MFASQSHQHLFLVPATTVHISTTPSCPAPARLGTALLFVRIPDLSFFQNGWKPRPYCKPVKKIRTELFTLYRLIMSIPGASDMGICSSSSAPKQSCHKCPSSAAPLRRHFLTPLRWFVFFGFATGEHRICFVDGFSKAGIMLLIHPDGLVRFATEPLF